MTNHCNAAGGGPNCVSVLSTWRAAFFVVLTSALLCAASGLSQHRTFDATQEAPVAVQNATTFLSTTAPAIQPVKPPVTATVTSSTSRAAHSKAGEHRSTIARPTRAAAAANDDSAAASQNLTGRDDAANRNDATTSIGSSGDNGSNDTSNSSSSSTGSGAKSSTVAAELLPQLGTPCSPDGGSGHCPLVNSVCVNGTCACKPGFLTETSDTAGASCVPPQPALGRPIPPLPVSPAGGSSGNAAGGPAGPAGAATGPPVAGPKKPSHQASQGENMIPMIVCLAIMFVGMCVALQLFSRARFRNQRSVFNSPNPRLLHLMKDSRKRRNSHVAAGMMVAGAGSRRPSCVSTMSMSRSRPGSRIGSRASSPTDLRRQAALNSVAAAAAELQRHQDREDNDCLSQQQQQPQLDQQRQQRTAADDDRAQAAELESLVASPKHLQVAQA